MRKFPFRVILISAFLFVLLDCGIPSILSLTSGDYSFIKEKEDPLGKSVGISCLKITPSPTSGDVGSKVKECEGPSILFLYSIGNKTDYSENSVKEAFKKAFTVNNYQALSVVTDGSVVSFKTSEGRENSLYLFNGKDKTSQTFQERHYNIYRTSSSATDALSDVKLTLKPETDGSNLSHLHIDIGTESKEKYSVEKTENLYRYNGMPFTSSNEESDGDDYSALEPGEEPYLHVYAALALFHTKTSDFSNDLWVDMIYLGSVKL